METLIISSTIEGKPVTYYLKATEEQKQKYNEIMQLNPDMPQMEAYKLAINQTN
jgi:hypothetical protein